MTPRRRALRGVTLIEVVIAGAILIAGVTGITSSWANSTAVLEHQRRLADATNLTRAQLERLLLLPQNTVDLTPGTHVMPSVDGFGRPATGPSSYGISYVVKGSTPITGFVELTVTTTWLERGGVQRNNTFNSYRER